MAFRLSAARRNGIRSLRQLRQFVRRVRMPGARTSQARERKEGAASSGMGDDEETAVQRPDSSSQQKTCPRCQFFGIGMETWNNHVRITGHETLIYECTAPGETRCILCLGQGRVKPELRAGYLLLHPGPDSVATDTPEYFSLLLAAVQLRKTME